MSFKEELFTYLKCNFPLIYIETVEIDRVAIEIENSIKEFNKWLATRDNISKRLKLKGLSVFRWNNFSGLKEIKDEGEEPIKNTNHPTGLFEFIIRDTSPSGVYIIDNFHLHWDDGRLSTYISVLREIYNSCKALNKHLLFVSPNLSIPQEIRDLFTVIEYKLPDYKDRFKFIQEQVKEMGCRVPSKEIEKATEISAGMTLNEIESAISIALSKSNGKHIHYEVISNEKIKSVKRSGLLEVINIDYGFDAVGGLDNFKNWAIKVAKVFKNLRKAIEYKMPMPKGCLIFGISGTGKSLLAKALAREFETPLYRADIGRLFGSLVGETESKTRELFKLIEALAPCVVLFDEIEKLFSGLESSSSSDSGTTARLIGSFLYFMQEKNIPAYFVATANNVEVLAPELLRAGRWDEIWFVDLPSLEERIDIFKIHIQKTGRDLNKYKNIEKFAVDTEGYTGAEIENIIKTAMFDAFYLDRDYNDNDIAKAIKETKPLSKIKSESIEYLRKWSTTRAKRANS